MKLISHRGNTKGKIKTLENTPEYIDQTLKMGYDVEIDLWVIDNMLFLGHNKPINEIKIEWILEPIFCSLDGTPNLKSTVQSISYLRLLDFGTDS